MYIHFVHTILYVYIYFCVADLFAFALFAWPINKAIYIQTHLCSLQLPL